MNYLAITYLLMTPPAFTAMLVRNRLIRATKFICTMLQGSSLDSKNSLQLIKSLEQNIYAFTIISLLAFLAFLLMLALILFTK